MAIEIVEVGPRDGLQSEVAGAADRRESGVRAPPRARRTAAHRGRELREPQTRAADGGRRSGAGRARGRRASRAVTSGSSSIARASNARGPPDAPRSAWRSPPANRSASAIRVAASTRASRPGSRSRDAARDAGIRAQITISTAFGCPFEGEVPAARVRRARRAARRRRTGRNRRRRHHRRRRADAGHRAHRACCVRRCRGMKLRAHFHNTRNTGLANAYAAVEVRRARARCELRRHRRLSVRAGCDRQHSDRRSHLHAASHGYRDRCRPAGAASRPASGCNRRSITPCPAWS